MEQLLSRAWHASRLRSIRAAGRYDSLIPLPLLHCVEKGGAGRGLSPAFGGAGGLPLSMEWRGVPVARRAG